MTRMWRVSRLPYVNLSGEGARIAGGRWNSPGRALVYAAENPALAVLEVRVHLDLEPDLIPADYVLMEIDASGLDVESVATPPADPTGFGDKWLAEGRTPILRVPSFIVPQSFNLLLNPLHPAAASASVMDTQPFDLDKRLWLPLTTTTS